jgi:hypothetical protein
MKGHNQSSCFLVMQTAFAHSNRFSGTTILCLADQGNFWFANQEREIAASATRASLSNQRNKSFKDIKTKCVMQYLI